MAKDISPTLPPHLDPPSAATPLPEICPSHGMWGHSPHLSLPLSQSQCPLHSERAHSPCCRYSSKSMAVSPTSSSSSGPPAGVSRPLTCLHHPVLCTGRLHSALHCSYLPTVLKAAAPVTQHDFPVGPDLLWTPRVRGWLRSWCKV